jgi:hypothetical protein
MTGVGHMLHGVVSFYYEGFRRMTTGRILWVIILIKLFVIFVVLRIFFFKPAMSGLSPQQKQNRVATTVLSKPEINETVNFKTQ